MSFLPPPDFSPESGTGFTSLHQRVHATHTESTASREGWSASLGLGSALCLTACLAVVLYFRVVVYGALAANGDAFAWVRILAPAAAVVFWGLVLSSIAFHLSGRKQAASVVTFVVVCSLMTFVDASRGMKQAAAAQVEQKVAAMIDDQEQTLAYDAAETERFLAQIKQQQEQARGAASAVGAQRKAFRQVFEAAKPGATEDLVARFRGELKTFEDLCRVLSGNDAEMMNAALQVLGSLEPHVADYAQALEQMDHAGWVDASTLPNAKTIDVRLVKLEAVDASRQRYFKSFLGIEAELRSRFEALGEHPARTEEFIGGMQRGVDVELLAKIQTNDQQIVAAARGILQTFRGGLGQWRVDAKDGLVMDTDDLLNRYQSYYTQLQTAVQEQLQTQKLLHHSRREALRWSRQQRR